MKIIVKINRREFVQRERDECLRGLGRVPEKSEEKLSPSNAYFLLLPLFSLHLRRQSRGLGQHIITDPARKISFYTYAGECFSHRD